MGSRRSESVSTSSTPTASPAADATSTPSSTSLALPSRNRSSSPPQRRHPARRRRQPVVLLPHERGKISAKTRPRAVDCSADADGPVEVRPSAVTVRFAVAARDGLFTGTLGCGRFLRRKPSHFSPPGISLCIPWATQLPLFSCSSWVSQSIAPPLSPEPGLRESDVALGLALLS